MDPELKKMLEDNLALSRENNTILKYLKKSQKRSMWFTVFYWIIIIAITGGALYFIQPLLGNVLNYYSAIGNGGDTNSDGSLNTTSNIPDVAHLQQLLNQVQK